MNIVDTNLCLLGVFQWEVLASVFGSASIACSQLPRGRALGLAILASRCATRGRDCHLLMVDAPGPLGGDTSQPEALFTLGCSLPRGPARWLL